MVCRHDEDYEDFISQGAEPLATRLQRLVSYFGDGDGINGLLTHMGDNETSCEILSLLWERRGADYVPYKPFIEWPETQQDERIRDLITGLMSLDPGKRITAKQALMHPWSSAEEISWRDREVRYLERPLICREKKQMDDSNQPREHRHKQVSPPAY